jgi:hypothetical protein
MSPFKAAIGVAADRDATNEEIQRVADGRINRADYPRQTTSPGGSLAHPINTCAPRPRRVRAAQRSMEALEQHRQRTPDTPEPPPPDPLDDLTGSSPELL